MRKKALIKVQENSNSHPFEDFDQTKYSSLDNTRDRSGTVAQLSKPSTATHGALSQQNRQSTGESKLVKGEPTQLKSSGLFVDQYETVDENDLKKLRALEEEDLTSII